MDESEDISRNKAAEIAEVDLRTIKRWMDAGHFRYRRDKRSGRIDINRESFYAYLRLRAGEPAAPE